MKRYLLLILIAYQFASCTNEKTFYVSTKGNDINPGTKDLPFLTIKRAQDEARKQSKKNDVKVYIREGTYYINQTLEFIDYDSGAENGSIIYSSFKNEKVVINGGVSLSIDSLFKVSENIMCINLKHYGIKNYGKLRNVGFARPYGPSFLELFINKIPFHLARYPNDSSLKIGKLVDAGSIPGKDSVSRGGRFAYNSNRPSFWLKSKDIWISGYFNRGWAEDAVQIADIDTVNKIFTTAQPHIYGFGSGAKWQRWYAYNIFEELDAAREYYLDKETGELFFYHDNKDSIKSIEISLMEKPMLTLIGADNITIRGITFENTRGLSVYMENTNNVIIENCIFRNIGSTAIVIGKGVKPNEAIRHNKNLGEPISKEVGSLNLYLYNNTVFNRNAGTNNGIINCHIYQIGAGGIILGGGNRITLDKGNNYVENCKIHDFNRIEKSYRAGIWLTGVGNRISNCEIFNASMMAINLIGNEHIIEYCDIHHVAKDMHDQGAIYYGRDPSELGNIVRYNYIHHIGNKHTSAGVYHDDGACGMKVYGNVFHKAGSMPVLIGGGNENEYMNNVFIDNKIGIHIDNRKNGWAKNHAAKGGVWDIENRLKAVNYKKPPYSIRYPSLVNYWENEHQYPYPLNNIVSNNIFYKTEKIIDGKKEWLRWENNHELQGFPDFWNQEENVFILKEGKIDPEIDGFVPINFSNIGCDL